MSAPPGPEAMAALVGRALGAEGRGWDAAALRALAEGPGGVVVGGPWGFALARVLGGEAELLLIAVEPACQRRGHGAAVLGRVEQAARDRGARRMILEVAADNGAARALYARAGYGEIARRVGYYAGAPPRDALVLDRAL